MDNAGQPDFLGWSPGEVEDAPSSGRLVGHWMPLDCEVAEECLSLLTQTIEAEIIPRLMLAHQPESAGCASQAVLPRPYKREVAELVRLVMTDDAPAISAYVGSLRARGVALESIYLELIAPAARCLGELWDSDQSDFTTVTIGTGHLQQLIRELAGTCPITINYECKQRKAVFAPTRGEQHTLGLTMVAELFIRAGWDVSTRFPGARDDLNALVHDEWFDLIGLSVGSEVQLELLREDVRSSRRASLNPAVVVMVGGPVFVAHPELAEQVGADATAIDGWQALAKAERMVLTPGADRPGGKAPSMDRSS